MKKRILIIMVFCMLLAPMAYALPNIDWAGVWLEHRYYDPNYSSSLNQYYISADLMLGGYTGNPEAIDVNLTSVPTGSTNLSYAGPYGSNHEFYETFGVLDLGSWETDYHFEVLGLTHDVTIPTGSLGLLDFAIPTFGDNRTVSWNSVEPHHADSTIMYRIRVQHFANGHATGGFLFDSGNLTEISYTFTGNPPEPGDYAFRLEAREFFDGQWVSRSTYYTYVNQPVPEPATMLLLGSGLIGLAGLGRRKFRKR